MAKRTGEAMIVRAKSLRDWMKSNFRKRQLAEMAEYGADAGWNGLTYTHDTVVLFDKFGDEIWEMAANTASDQGVSVPVLISQFSRADMTSSLLGFKNLMVWFAAEEYARELSESDWKDDRP